MRTLTLDSRMTTIASMAEKDKVTADIGTDHGYLIIWLAQNSIIPKGYACDINSKPLKQAERMIAKYGVDDIVSPVLANGIQGLEPLGIEQFIIAGMGGELIASILSDGKWAHKTENVFILQPMSRDNKLRQSLYKMGFVINAEKAVTKGRHTYTVIKAEYSGVSKDIDIKFAWTGLHWDNDDPLSRKYLERKLNRLQAMKPSLDNDEDKLKLLDDLKERLKNNA